VRSFSLNHDGLISSFSEQEQIWAPRHMMQPALACHGRKMRRSGRLPPALVHKNLRTGHHVNALSCGENRRSGAIMEVCRTCPPFEGRAKPMFLNISPTLCKLQRANGKSSEPPVEETTASLSQEFEAQEPMGDVS